MSIETTIHFVDMSTRAGMASRRRRMPRPGPPFALEVALAQKLVAWIDELRVEFQPLVQLIGEPRFDSALRLDESRHGRRVRSLTEPVRRKVERDVNRLAPEIDRAGKAVAQAHKQLLDRQTKAALGVTVPTSDPKVPGKIDQFVSKNLTRIQAIGDQLVSQVEAIVIDAWDQGLSQAEVAQLIEKRIGVAESYARFLARDQMNALYAQVTRARHDELGVRLFQWMTEHDGHVRKSHALKHGKVFPYKGSRAPSFLPGDERGCRCWEVPVFDEIKARLFAQKGRQRVA